MIVTKELIHAFKRHETLVVDWHKGCPLSLSLSTRDYDTREESSQTFTSTDTNDFRVSHSSQATKGCFVVQFINQSDTAIATLARLLKPGDIIGFEAMHNDNELCRKAGLHLEVLEVWILRKKRNGCVYPFAYMIIDYNVREDGYTELCTPSCKSYSLV